MGKKKVGPQFIDEWAAKGLSELTPEEQLDLLLPAIRRYESAMATNKAKADFLREIAIDAMQKSCLSEYQTKTKRTMGSLVYQAASLSGSLAVLKARRIRSAVSAALGKDRGSRSVISERKISWKIDWDLIAKGGPDLLERIRRITGTKKPALTVSPTTKQARRGKQGKRRATSAS